MEVQITVGVPTFFPEMQREVEYFARVTERCTTLGTFLDKDLEKLDDHGCPKIQDLVVEEMWICSSYPFRHKTTLHTLKCAESEAKLLGNWTIQHSRL